LPVPVSPSITTVASVGAIRSIVAHDHVVVVHRADPDLVLLEHPLLITLDRAQHALPQVQGRAALEERHLGRRDEVRELLHRSR
jgi:hypothetical protein